MKYHQLCLLLLLFVLTAVSSSPRVQTATLPDAPRVVRAVAPAVYHPIAIQAHASGKVVVEVEVGADGQVMSARVVSGHPLLQVAAVKAARRWQFAPNDKNSLAKVGLTFDFQVVSTKEDQEVSFNAPYELTYFIYPCSTIETSDK